MTQEMKFCPACRQEKSRDSFYKDRSHKDGLASQCKACRKEYYSAWSKTERGREIARKLSAKHAKTEKFKISQKRYQGKQNFKDNQKRYRQSKKGVEARIKAYNKNHEKHAARRAVSYAIKNGTLVRQPCEVCGKTVNIEGHHDDYSKQLDVRWLCKKHHDQHHAEC